LLSVLGSRPGSKHAYLIGSIPHAGYPIPSLRLTYFTYPQRTDVTQLLLHLQPPIRFPRLASRLINGSQDYAHDFQQTLYCTYLLILSLPSSLVQVIFRVPLSIYLVSVPAQPHLYNVSR
jgi:hypothetical protein